jgi:myo-inositol-1(or 4)-monophosphatase
MSWSKNVPWASATPVATEWREDLFSSEYYDVIRKATALGGKIVREASVNGTILEVQAKVDQTLVTQVDLAWEKAITDVIKSWSHGTVRGEEFGETKWTDENLVWFLDPVDGTWSFTRGQQYSTVGVVLYKDGAAHIWAICHPYEKRMIISESGKGSWVFELDDRMERIPGSIPKKVEVSQNMKNPVVYMDALFNAKTTPRKTAAINGFNATGEVLNLRMTGSNIDQQFQVAMGRWDITISDAKWGYHDLAVGDLAIREAGGAFLDVQTWEPINDKTEVAVWGNPAILTKYKDMLQQAYTWYDGFKIS